MDKQTIESLVKALMNVDSSVREEAKEALEKIDPNWRKSEGAKAASPSILSALTKGDRFSKESAAAALGEIEDVSGLEPLFTALKDNNWFVREAAIDAIIKIDPGWTKSKKGEDTILDFIHGITYKGDAIGIIIARILKKIGDKKFLEPLIIAYTNVFGEVRSAISETLQSIEPNWRESEAARSVISKLIASVKDITKDMRSRTHAIHDLEKIGNKTDLLSLLLVLTEEHDVKIREEIITLLSKVDSNWRASEQIKEFIPLLIAALKEKNTENQPLAAQTLIEIDAHLIVAPLLEMLKDENESARQAAEKILSSIGWDARALIIIADDNLSELRNFKAKTLERMRQIIKWNIESASCDSCGKEIEAPFGYIGIPAGYSSRYLLCPACFDRGWKGHDRTVAKERAIYWWLTGEDRI